MISTSISCTLRLDYYCARTGIYLVQTGLASSYCEHSEVVVVPRHARRRRGETAWTLVRIRISATDRGAAGTAAPALRDYEEGGLLAATAPLANGLLLPLLGELENPVVLRLVLRQEPEARRPGWHGAWHGGLWQASCTPRVTGNGGSAP